MLGKWGVFIAVMACFSTFAVADIQVANKTLWIPRRGQLFEGMPSNYGVASEPDRQHSAVVIISLELGWSDVLGRADSRTSPESFARAVDTALTQAGAPPRTVYYSLENFPVVDSDWTPRANADRSQVNAFDGGAFVKSMAESDVPVSLVLRVEKSARPIGNFPKPAATTRKWLAFHVTEPPFRIALDGRVTPLESLAMFYAMFGVLLIFCCFAAYGVAVGRSANKAVAARRYHRAMRASMIAVPLLHLPVFLWVWGSGIDKRMSSALFGQTVPLLMIGMMLSVFALRIPLKQLNKFEADTLEVPLPPPLTPEEEQERATRAKAKSISFVTTMLALGAVGAAGFSLVNNGNPRPVILSLLACLLISLLTMPAFENAVYRRLKRKTPPFGESAVLAAREIGSSVGVDFRSVVVDATSPGVTGSIDIFRNLKVSSSAATSLTPDEFRALVLHECAHVQLGHLRKRFLLRLPFTVVFFVVPVFVFSNVKLSPQSFLPIAALGSLALLLPSLFLFRKTYVSQEYEADRFVIEQTRQIEPTISLLNKTVATTGPVMAELETTHPALSARLQALRQAGAELGIC